MKIQTLLTALAAAGFQVSAVGKADSKTHEVEIWLGYDFVITVQVQGKHRRGESVVAGYVVMAQAYRTTWEDGASVVWESESEWLTTAAAAVSKAREYRKGYEAQAEQEAKYEAEYEAAMNAAQYAEV